MSKRLNYLDHPNAIQALRALNTYVRQCGLEQNLIELIFLRVSQLNGCAYCLDMHSKDARAAGETEQRLYLLQAWRESPFYSERERAALAWCEAVTHLGTDGVADDVYAQALQQFTEAELVNLNMTVILINSWNRIAIPFKAVPGSYKPAAH
jgi:AhpD family alkylhydroperoxidase